MPPAVPNLLSIAAQYGLVGLVLLAAGWYVFMRDKKHEETLDKVREEHRAERKEWSDILAAQHREALEVTSKNTLILTEIATIIRRLK